MPHRYSNKLLHQIRNDLDVAALIRDVLRLPYKIHDGVFRFECPCCHGSDCATNPKTNLARCFHCQRNFNPIDLAMVVQHCTFIDAVEFLRLMLRDPASHRD
jgi:hypothetical protein